MLRVVPSTVEGRRVITKKPQRLRDSEVKKRREPEIHVFFLVVFVATFVSIEACMTVK
jgi:hypothetical protein